MNKGLFLLRTVGGVLLMILGVFLRIQHIYIGSFIVFLILTLMEAGLLYYESRDILDFRILLSLSWLGGITLAVLNLSELQSDWSLKMWFTVGGFYFLTIAAFDVTSVLQPEFSNRKKKKAPVLHRQPLEERVVSKRVFECIIGLFVLIAGSFLVESVVFDFVYPVFSDKPHAYTAFHITGIHYFVVSTPFVHALSVYYFMKGKPDRNRILIVGAINGICLVIALLILSKLQLFFGLVMAFCMWISLKERFSKKQMIRLLILGGAAFVILAFAMIFLRKYPENYLEGIFRFRNQKIPVSVQYIYMYIVNNFENLHLLTRHMTGFTNGRRILYPFICLTGMKFIPAVASFMSVEMFLTCEELTTLTVLYDVYGDFGAAGVYGFAILLGVFLYLVTLNKKKGRIGGLLLNGQLVIYVTLSFFSVWFSNPTTWFYFALTLCLALWCRKEEGRFRFNLE